MAIDTAMSNKNKVAPLLQNTFELVPMPRLSEIPLEGKELSVEEYKEFLLALEKAQEISKGKVNFLSIMKTAKIIG